MPEAGSGTREVSEAVNARILSRILAFSGLPVALALGLFPLFYYLKARVLHVSVWYWLEDACCGWSAHLSLRHAQRILLSNFVLRRWCRKWTCQWA